MVICHRRQAPESRKQAGLKLANPSKEEDLQSSWCQLGILSGKSPVQNRHTPKLTKGEV